MIRPGDAELQALRIRAYGPDADIGADPAALHRLRELERRGATPESDDETPRGLPTETPAPSDDDGGGDADPPAPWWRRRPVVAILAIVAVVAIVVGVWQWAGTRPDRTLDMTSPEREIPFPDGYSWLPRALGISRDALHSYRGVGDIIVWAGTARDGVSCILVAGTDQPFGFGCARVGTDPIADIVLDSDMASMPSTGLPERSTLRFVWRGDRVDVWITEPPEP